jgi:hypothetical protein
MLGSRDHFGERRQEMARQGYTPEQIIGKLREAEVLLSKGETVGQACRKIGVAEQPELPTLGLAVRTSEAASQGDLLNSLKLLASFPGRFDTRHAV